jgi:SAM-dependent methyltransferase
LPGSQTAGRIHPRASFAPAHGAVNIAAKERGGGTSVGGARGYWDQVAEEKTFTHPLNAAWLGCWVAPGARILDYGCGYGRVLGDLAALGYRNAAGVDRSPAMIERGRREHPELDLRVIEADTAPFADGTFDVVLLFAVLTCIASDDDQRALVGDIMRLLKPGGLIYLSDMPLQTDARNRARYDAGAARFGAYGVFETEDGGVLRHHTEAHFDALLAGFEPVARETLAIRTMNGNPATAVQILARLRS